MRRGASMLMRKSGTLAGVMELTLFLRIARTGFGMMTTLPYHRRLLTNAAMGNNRYNCGYGLTTSFRLQSSTTSSFVPPDPPASKGTSVFSDVDLNVAPTAEVEGRNGDEDAVFVVTGANRGIGLEMVKALACRTKGRIVACCRKPAEFSLDDSLFPSSRVSVMELDLERQETIDSLKGRIEEELGSDRVDGLFNVAGILGDGKTTPGPERSLAMLNRNWIDKTMAINVVGPVMLVQALAPMMKRSRKDTGTPRSIVVNVSARVGSISDNVLGGWYSYRFSKSALNQATRTMAHELKRQGTYAIAVHPGTTETDLSRPFHRNVKKGSLFPPEFTVKQILDIVDSMNGTHTGGLYDWSGKAIPF